MLFLSPLLIIDATVFFIGTLPFLTTVIEGLKGKKHPWFFDVYQKDFLIFFKPWILTKGLELTYPIFLFFIPLIILGSFLLLLKKMVYFQDLSKGQQFCGVCRIPIRVKISFLLMENIFCQIIDKFLKFLDIEYLIPYILIKHKNLS